MNLVIRASGYANLLGGKAAKVPHRVRFIFGTVALPPVSSFSRSPRYVLIQRVLENYPHPADTRENV